MLFMYFGDAKFISVVKNMFWKKKKEKLISKMATKVRIHCKFWVIFCRSVTVWCIGSFLLFFNLSWCILLNFGPYVLLKIMGIILRAKNPRWLLKHRLSSTNSQFLVYMKFDVCFLMYFGDTEFIQVVKNVFLKKKKKNWYPKWPPKYESTVHS